MRESAAVAVHTTSRFFKHLCVKSCQKRIGAEQGFVGDTSYRGFAETGSFGTGNPLGSVVLGGALIAGLRRAVTPGVRHTPPYRTSTHPALGARPTETRRVRANDLRIKVHSCQRSPNNLLGTLNLFPVTGHRSPVTGHPPSLETSAPPTACFWTPS